MGDCPFSIKYERLYAICEYIEVTVNKVFTEGWRRFKFRRALTNETLQMWVELKEECGSVMLSNSEDYVTWKLDPKGFSVRSLYRALKIGSMGFPFNSLWRYKIPAKVRVFLWLAVRKSILTKDVLHRRGWKGDKMCQFCGVDETITHLLFTCPLARYVWNVASCAFGFKSKPRSMQHMLGAWIRSFSKSDKKLVTVDRKSTRLNSSHPV